MVRFDGDDWMKGLLPYFGSSNTAFRIGDGLSHSVGIDPYRFPGYLTPGFNPAVATNVSVVDGVLKNGVLNNTSVYSIGGAKLHEFGALTTTFSNSGSWPHTITAHATHSAVTGEDVALYNLATTEYLFYSWNDTTDGDIGRYNLSSTFDDDYVSTVATGGAVLTAGVPHPMIIGDDGVLYIGNANKLAALDGRTNSAGDFEASALDLPTGYIITSYSKTPLYLVIYAYKVEAASSIYRSEATAFYWDYFSSSSTYAISLSGNYVNGGFTFNGVPGCFTEYGNSDLPVGKQGKLLLANGNSFVEQIAFDGSAPVWGGVEATTNTITWNSAGVVYRFGSPYKGLPGGLNKIAQLTGTTSAMLKNFAQHRLFASSGGTINGGLETLSADYGIATAYTGLKQLPPYLRSRYQVKFVRVNYRNTVSSGRGFRVGLHTDNTPTTSDTPGGITWLYDSATGAASVTKLSKIYEFDIDGKTLPQVSSSIGVYFNWGNESPSSGSDAVGVEAVEIYLEPIAITND